jgi:hypothetical protein
MQEKKRYENNSTVRGVNASVFAFFIGFFIALRDTLFNMYNYENHEQTRFSHVPLPPPTRAQPCGLASLGRRGIA